MSVPGRDDAQPRAELDLGPESLSLLEMLGWVDRRAAVVRHLAVAPDAGHELRRAGWHADPAVAVHDEPQDVTAARAEVDASSSWSRRESPHRNREQADGGNSARAARADAART